MPIELRHVVDLCRNGGSIDRMKIPGGAFTSKPHFNEYTNTLVEHHVGRVLLLWRRCRERHLASLIELHQRRVHGDTSIGVVRQIDRGWRYIRTQGREKGTHPSKLRRFCTIVLCLQGDPCECFLFLILYYIDINNEFLKVQLKRREL